MFDSPFPEPKTAEEDWREHLEMCGLGEPDMGDFEYHGGFRSLAPFACTCGHDIGAHGIESGQRVGCFSQGCACKRFNRRREE